MKTYACRGVTLAIVGALALATMTASAAAETLKAFATRASSETGINSHFFADRAFLQAARRGLGHAES
ncbi:MAG: hypothetical protein JWQ87_131 [Candidatus Sulfotelmatobacter sp.]|nr:hypothetical protein [Candidatus Sulfotelmatobacter sp.]